MGRWRVTLPVTEWSPLQDFATGLQVVYGRFVGILVDPTPRLFVTTEQKPVRRDLSFSCCLEFVLLTARVFASSWKVS